MSSTASAPSAHCDCQAISARRGAVAEKIGTYLAVFGLAAFVLSSLLSQRGAGWLTAAVMFLGWLVRDAAKLFRVERPDDRALLKLACMIALDGICVGTTYAGFFYQG